MSTCEEPTKLTSVEEDTEVSTSDNTPTNLLTTGDSTVDGNIAPVTSDSSSTDVHPAVIPLGYAVSQTVLPSPVLWMNESVSDTGQGNDLMSFQKDIYDGQAIRGRCGLYNLGNTCFMNAGLQCLMSTTPLITFLLSHIASHPTPDHTLLGSFRRLFAKIWSGRLVMVYPKEFKQTLAMYHPQFQDYRQHDCQEFLALLLDTLHEQLNVNRDSSNQNQEAGPSGLQQPIESEQSMNNMSTTNQTNQETRNVDQSNSSSSCHSNLTFDNMKENKENSALTENNIQVSSSFTQRIDSMEKDKNSSNLVSFTINAISEDSNHSIASEHSSDSECTVIKNLKLRSSPVVNQSSDVECSASTSEVFHNCLKDCNVSSSADDHVENNVSMATGKTVGEGFKRVQSLQDFKSDSSDACCSKAPEGIQIVKSSSDIDLVSKASGDFDDRYDSCGGISLTPSTSINIVSSCMASEMIGNLDRQGRGRTEASSSMSEPVMLNNAKAVASEASVEDIYAKETKTSNINMLATDYMDEIVTTDSEKFTKHDNTTIVNDIVEESNILNNVMEATTKKDSSFHHNKIKDVNIRADKKTRSPKGACGSTSVANNENDDCFVNNSKRMKFEGTEKNLQMQEISKINKQKILFGSSQSKIANIHTDHIRHGSVNSMSVDSDVESDIMDDADRDVDMDISDADDNDEDGVGQEVKCATGGASYTASDVLAAEKSWHKYQDKNNSMVVDTFQGQFKSTVVCAECHQVSVTFEAFMYLSVPIPHAMERQVCITLISPQAEPTQYLLVMHKQDKILKVKQELRQLIGGQGSCDLIMAEVLNWHISRILEDNTMLRYINDSTRQIYAFLVDQSTVGDLSNPDPITSSEDHKYKDVFSHMGEFSAAESSTFDSQNTFGSHSPSYSPLHSVAGSQDSQFNNSTLTSAAQGTGNDYFNGGMWDWGQRSTEKRRGSLETEAEDNWLMADSTTSVKEEDGENGGKVTADDKADDNVVSSTSALPTTIGTDGWKSCAICLEELTDNELMVHTSCGGTFCPNCLEMSLQHFRDATYCCPVCSTPADMTEDFVPLASAASHKPKTRIVTVPISYRCERDLSGGVNPYLFSHPSLLNLPSNLSGSHIYTCLQDILQFPCHFRVLLTDGQGLHCSRCLYMEHCTGCEIPQDGEVVLRPGDHLTVSMETVTEVEVMASQCVRQHVTMEKHRNNEPTTLQDCFTEFTQSEELDENNPWFCPVCKHNQRAEKTMTVWQYPDTLIIQLKRFLFHELSSTKVDNQVIFPLDDLDLNNFISGPKTKNCLYNLYSIVCHFGGANSGHYTSYAKHAVDGKWYYYNDETVTQQTPTDDDYTSTYVLFYQRKGTDKALQIPEDLDLTSGMADDIHIGATSVLYQPPEGEITLNNLTEAPSTSCHEVAPSTGGYDLLASESGILIGQTDSENLIGQSDDKGEELSLDKTASKVEKVEADSTGGGATLDFYS